MMRSKLPNSVLRRVWNLADIDGDGMLDRDEFAVAMFLIDHKIGGNDIPGSLPERLIPPSKMRLFTARSDERRGRPSDDYNGGGNSMMTSPEASYSRDSGYGRDATYRGGGGGGVKGGKYDDSVGGRNSSSHARPAEEYDDDSHLSSFIDRGQ